jgi:hypothetical protein
MIVNLNQELKKIRKHVSSCKKHLIYKGIWPFDEAVYFFGLFLKFKRIVF